MKPSKPPTTAAAMLERARAEHQATQMDLGDPREYAWSAGVCCASAEAARSLRIREREIEALTRRLEITTGNLRTLADEMAKAGERIAKLKASLREMRDMVDEAASWSSHVNWRRADVLARLAEDT